MLRNVKDNQTWIFLTNLHNFTLVIYYRKDQLPVYDECMYVFKPSFDLYFFYSI